MKPTDNSAQNDLLIQGVRLASQSETARNKLYTLTCRDGAVASVIEETSENRDDSTPSLPSLHVVNAHGKGILLPSLCHAHIHLDKCYLLSQCDALVTGDLSEALRVTAKAKAAFTSNLDDLYERGRRLVLASIEAGVTHMRAHVEVDDTVKNACLDTALRLKQEFQASCDIQIAVFAQDPIFIDSGPGPNWDLLCAAAASPGIEAVGSAPYVEASTERAKDNILLILDLAHKLGLHADFHLDYNLDASAAPLTPFVLYRVRERVRAGTWRRTQRVCIGHATRLTLWTDEDWAAFARAVHADGLPVSLVGLPQSDVYMMGRDRPPVPGAPRGTLDPVRLRRAHELGVALAVNNVGNAFTPQGAPDPLALCPLGVALFQAGAARDCETLIESVTLHARSAIGMTPPPPPGSAGDTMHAPGLVPRVGDPADFVLLHENDDVQSAACSPSFSRTTIKAGRVVARRESRVWHLGSRGEGAAAPDER